MVRILVTGWAGFIGIYICVNLHEVDHEKVSLDYFINSSKQVSNPINKNYRSKGINQNLMNNFKGTILENNYWGNIFKF